MKYIFINICSVQKESEKHFMLQYNIFSSGCIIAILITEAKGGHSDLNKSHSNQMIRTFE
jgi:hypothetical protein